MATSRWSMRMHAGRLNEMTTRRPWHPPALVLPRVFCIVQLSPAALFGRPVLAARLGQEKRVRMLGHPPGHMASSRRSVVLTSDSAALAARQPDSEVQGGAEQGLDSARPSHSPPHLPEGRKSCRCPTPPATRTPGTEQLRAPHMCLPAPPGPPGACPEVPQGAPA
jgi:hypothetical protein